ncbi:hypothetical protein BDN72DRAFT_847187, partial [Pluteus cervinus]
RDSLDTAITLLQVSKFVHHRAEHVVNETVVISEDAIATELYPPQIANSCHDFTGFFNRYGQHILNLTLRELSDEKITSFLERCPATRRLRLGRFSSHFKAFETILDHVPKIEQLTAYFAKIAVPQDASLGRAYRQLTHLDMIMDGDTVPLMGWLAFLAQLPRLTHLAVDRESANEPVVLEVFRGCRKLQVMVLAGGDFQPNQGACTEATEGQEGVEDDRIVCLEVDTAKSWLAGARRERDMWRHAEEIILERRKRRQEGSELATCGITYS